MDGIILVDKPSGWTSHDAAAYIKKVLGVKRAGHTGTLDPDATGLVVVMVGKATRLARYFEQDTKTYSAVMILGTETDTQDASGTVTKECPVPELDRTTVEEVFASFTGEITQVPPMYSAVKKNGKPLYVLARAGEEVERAPRTVRIHRLEIKSIDNGRISFDAVCSKGTYIRTLCKDISEALGSCGHLESLRRTAAGGYTVDGAVSLSGKPGKDEIEPCIIGFGEVLPSMARVVADAYTASMIRNGVAPFFDELELPQGPPEVGETVGISGLGGELIAVGTALPDSLSGRIRIKLDMVFA